MADKVQASDARKQKLKSLPVRQIILAQVAVILCCVLAWLICENVVKKTYSDPVFRAQFKIVDEGYDKYPYLKEQDSDGNPIMDGGLKVLEYKSIADEIAKNDFYKQVIYDNDLWNQYELSSGRIKDRITWQNDPADATGHTILIDMAYPDEEVARTVLLAEAQKLEDLFQNNAVVNKIIPVTEANEISYIGKVADSHRTGPNTLLWVIVIGLIAEGIFLTMAFQDGWKNKVNCVIMGFANLSRGQIMRGILFLLFQIVFFGYLFFWGMGWLDKLTTLGTIRYERFQTSPNVNETVLPGDNSFKILLYGVLTIFFIVAFVYTYYVNIKQGRLLARIEASGKKLKSGKDDLRSLVDDQFHRTLLALPVTGILLFTVMPIIFMVLVAFTNYSGIRDGYSNLFEWVGLKNFNQLVVWTSGGSGNKTFMATFGEILAWTLIWAFFATFTNYFLGMFVAMAINKKGIKFKKGWRTVLVLTIAIPQFISLLYVSKAFANNGLINLFLQEMGWIKQPIKFWDEPMLARITVIGINIWIGIPYLMLITTGILMNIPADLYESARIDGANPWQQYTKITLPYMLFVTGPYLLTSFTGNMNNFNVIYLLTGGGPNKAGAYSAGGVSAGETDLLITWLFNITQGGEHQYYQASVIGIMVFLVVAIISLVVYNLLPSNKNEEDFQ